MDVRVRSVRMNQVGLTKALLDILCMLRKAVDVDDSGDSAPPHAGAFQMLHQPVLRDFAVRVGVREPASRRIPVKSIKCKASRILARGADASGPYLRDTTMFSCHFPSDRIRLIGRIIDNDNQVAGHADW
jgi:hypothetical protein